MLPKRPNQNFKVLAKHVNKVQTDSSGRTTPVLKWFTLLQWELMANQKQTLPDGQVVTNSGWIKVNHKTYFEPPDPPAPEKKKQEEKEAKLAKKYEVMVAEFSKGATKRYTVGDMKKFAKQMGFNIKSIDSLSKSDLAEAIHKNMQ